MDTPGYSDWHLKEEDILKMIWLDFKGNAFMEDRHLTGIISLHEISQLTASHVSKVSLTTAPYGLFD
jgi:hypothetical protein